MSSLLVKNPKLVGCYLSYIAIHKEDQFATGCWGGGIINIYGIAICKMKYFTLQRRGLHFSVKKPDQHASCFRDQKMSSTPVDVLTNKKCTARQSMFFLSKKGQQASRLFVKKTGSRPVDFFFVKNHASRASPFFGPKKPTRKSIFSPRAREVRDTQGQNEKS